jgi:hypothetical protein
MQKRSAAIGNCGHSAMIEALESRRHLSASLPHVHLPAGAVAPAKVTATPTDLTPDIQGIVKRNFNGKYIVPEVIIRNAGPATAKGTLRISIEFSYYYSGAYPRLFRTVNTAINIKSGGSKTVRIGGNIPKSFPTFDYHMVAVINANKKIPETNYANDTQVTGSYFYLA